MTSTEPSRPARQWRVRYVIAVILLGALAGSVAGLVSYLRLGSETRALSRALMSSVEGEWNKKFGISVGSCTLGLVRLGGRCFQMPPEARAAMEAARGAEVGIYELRRVPGEFHHGHLLRVADQAVKGLGWERVVGVTQEREIVAIYVPRKGLTMKRVACCVVVLNERQLVVVSARVNPEPLLEIAARELNGRPNWLSRGHLASAPAAMVKSAP